MLKSGYATTERISNDVKGIISDLKNIYFPNKEPLTDDEILVQKLCVYLEKILRYGAREKYTLLGVRKDYWNYISESVPKDETVIYVNSIQELRTNQGKGRAFLRQALVEKSLADTLQRCVINEKLTKEYYGVESLLKTEQHFNELLHSLYDLNSVDFHLPHKGYDLDRSWPSFSRKRGSAQSTSSVEKAQEISESDPLYILNTVINRLSNTLNAWKGVSTSNKLDSIPKPQVMMEQMLIINEDVIKLKTKSENEILSLNKDLVKARKEKEYLMKNSESNVKQIHERYLDLQNADKTSDHLKGVYDQLRNVESELVQIRNEKSIIESELEELRIENTQYKLENDILINDLESIDNKLKGARLSISFDQSPKETGLLIENNKNSPRSTSYDAIDGATGSEVVLEEVTGKVSDNDSLDDCNEPGDQEDGLFKRRKKKNRKEILMKLSSIQEELSSSNHEKKKYEEEIVILKSALLRKANEVPKDEKDIKIEELQSENESLDKKCKEMEHQMTDLNKTIEMLNVKTLTLLQRIDELQMKLTDKEEKHVEQVTASANEQIAALESQIENLQNEKENTLSIKEYEIKTLKFELSGLEINNETIKKELNGLIAAHDHMKKEILKKDEIEMKKKQNEDSLYDQKLVLENKCKELDESLSMSERETAILKTELLKCSQEKDQDTLTKVNLKHTISNMMDERKTMEHKYKEEIEFLQDENAELKSHLVNLTRDKHELWQKSELLEIELKAKGTERWVKDEEITNCTQCNELFTLTLRKHHCRLCGNIFCKSCANRWIKTHHSNKRKRCCNTCADGYIEGHPQDSDVVDGDDGQSDVGSMRSFSNAEDFEWSNELGSEQSGSSDPFVMLDSSNVSNSGSFGPSEEILIKENDVKKDPIIPVVQQLLKGDNEKDSIKEKVEITLTAGQRCILPIVIGGENFDFIWEFSSTPRDTGFGVAFKLNEEENDTEIQTIIPLSRYISHKQTIHGKMTIAKPGIYYLVFDNSYSRLMSKYITCSFILSQC